MHGLALRATLRHELPDHVIDNGSSIIAYVVRRDQAGVCLIQSHRRSTMSAEMAQVGTVTNLLGICVSLSGQTRYLQFLQLYLIVSK